MQTDLSESGFILRILKLIVITLFIRFHRKDTIGSDFSGKMYGYETSNGSFALASKSLRFTYCLPQQMQQLHHAVYAVIDQGDQAINGFFMKWHVFMNASGHHQHSIYALYDAPLSVPRQNLAVNLAKSSLGGLEQVAVSSVHYRMMLNRINFAYQEGPSAVQHIDELGMIRLLNDSGVKLNLDRVQQSCTSSISQSNDSSLHGGASDRIFFERRSFLQYTPFENHQNEHIIPICPGSYYQSHDTGNHGYERFQYYPYPELLVCAHQYMPMPNWGDLHLIRMPAHYQTHIDTLNFGHWDWQGNRAYGFHYHPVKMLMHILNARLLQANLLSEYQFLDERALVAVSMYYSMMSNERRRMSYATLGESLRMCAKYLVYFRHYALELETGSVHETKEMAHIAITDMINHPCHYSIEEFLAPGYEGALSDFCLSEEYSKRVKISLTVLQNMISRAIVGQSDFKTYGLHKILPANWQQATLAQHRVFYEFITHILHPLTQRSIRYALQNYRSLKIIPLAGLNRAALADYLGVKNVSLIHAEHLFLEGGRVYYEMDQASNSPWEMIKKRIWLQGKMRARRLLSKISMLKPFLRFEIKRQLKVLEQLNNYKVLDHAVQMFKSEELMALLRFTIDSAFEKISRLQVGDRIRFNGQLPVKALSEEKLHLSYLAPVSQFQLGGVFQKKSNRVPDERYPHILCFGFVKAQSQDFQKQSSCYRPRCVFNQPITQKELRIRPLRQIKASQSMAQYCDGQQKHSHYQFWDMWGDALDEKFDTKQIDSHGVDFPEKIDILSHAPEPCQMQSYSHPAYETK